MKFLNWLVLRLVNEHLIESLSGILVEDVADLGTGCLMGYGMGNEVIHKKIQKLNIKNQNENAKCKKTIDVISAKVGIQNLSLCRADI